MGRQGDVGPEGPPGASDEGFVCKKRLSHNQIHKHLNASQWLTNNRQKIDLWYDNLYR